MGTEVTGSWGTWEELLLGGAVLRHGTRDWDVVAAELRARTICPYTFTPEACKAKYEDLKERYTGCTAWFEELRKKRVAELKRALELSEDSIGSLESKIESLKAEKKENERDNSCVHNNNGSGAVEQKLHLTLPKLERVESFTREISKDGLSAGSFTHETRANWSASDQEMETKPEVSHSCDEYEKVPNVVDKLAYAMYGGQVRGSTMKKRRGKRKRKDCSRNNNGKETSVGDSEFLLDLSGDVVVSGCKENSTSNNCVVEDQRRSFREDGVECLMEILDSVLENKVASAFRRRLDSQKRGRYKKMIRRHMDLDTIRSRITTQAIKSAKELFRDLLLLTNNALVFYSKTTREYKSALLLRDLITKKLRQKQSPHNFTIRSPEPTRVDHSVSPKIPVHSNAPPPPVKPRSVRPGNRKIVASKVDGASISASGVSLGARKAPGKLSPNSTPPSVESLSVNKKKKKKGIGRPKRVGRGGAGQGPIMAVKGNRKVRAK